MRLSFVLCAFLALATASAAQTPAAATRAAGVDAGVLFPDEGFEPTVTLGGFGEYDLTPRVRVRALLGWASPGFDGRTEDDLRQVRLTFNVAYNRQNGGSQPYVTGVEYPISDVRASRARRVGSWSAIRRASRTQRD